MQSLRGMMLNRIWALYFQMKDLKLACPKRPTKDLPTD